MSISLSWHLVEPGKGHHLPGTSTDWAVFQDLFHNRNLTRSDYVTFHAMHRATGLVKSFWGAIADVLEELPCEAEIEIRGEF
jgi:hypothetical protein